MRNIRVRMTEVGPRDGLQNAPEHISTDDKVAFIDRLSAAGPDEIEVSSFVSPRWVPQLGDAAEVFARIERRPGIVYSALVPNERGLTDALEAGADKVAVFTAASETFSQRNTNASIDETLARFGPVVTAAHAAGIPVRAYVSCVVACPYEGPISPKRVREVVGRLLDLGADEIDLGETLGVAGPLQIEHLYGGLGRLIGPGRTTLHLHDTRGMALACAYKAIECGVRSFDASCGGLGGCPFAPGAAGNVATEDLHQLLTVSRLRTGLDLETQFAACRFIEGVLERPLPGRVFGADGRETKEAITPPCASQPSASRS